MNTPSLNESETTRLCKHIERWLRKNNFISEDLTIVIKIQVIPREPRVVVSVQDFYELDIENILQIKLSELDNINTGAKNAMSREGIYTVGDVVNFVKINGSSGLMKLRGFGRKGFNNTRDSLCELGLRLGSEWSRKSNTFWKPSDDPNV